jgi:hypothetical protein
MVDCCVWLQLGQKIASASWIMVHEKHCREGSYIFLCKESVIEAQRCHPKEVATA